MSGIKQNIIVYLVTAALVFYAFTCFTDKVGGRFEDVYSVVTNIRILKDGSADIEETWVLKKKHHYTIYRYLGKYDKSQITIQSYTINGTNRPILELNSKDDIDYLKYDLLNDHMSDERCGLLENLEYGKLYGTFLLFTTMHTKCECQMQYHINNFVQNYDDYTGICFPALFCDLVYGPKKVEIIIENDYGLDFSERYIGYNGSVLHDGKTTKIIFKNKIIYEIVMAFKREKNNTEISNNKLFDEVEEAEEKASRRINDSSFINEILNFLNRYVYDNVEHLLLSSFLSIIILLILFCVKEMLKP